MATKDERPTLLSKVAMFVRNPTKDWAELDRIEPEQETGYDKQALKAMIERKRQNDFVRKREFDQLRKLRNRGGDALGAMARPSVFQSSMATDPDGRAVTLKKIDEIEAQMSKQWWKGKQDAAGAAKSPGFPVAAKRADADEAAPSVPSDPVSEPPTMGFERTILSDAVAARGQTDDFVATAMGEASPRPPRATPAPANKPPVMAPMGALAHSYDGSEAGFSTSKLFAIEVDELATDPELEEAAIRFANGDDVGAEKGLLEALRGNGIDPVAGMSWAAALLDLYRATNKPEQFAAAVGEFGFYFDQVMPVWAAIGDGLPLVKTVASKPVAVTVVSGALWDCPADLTAQAMESLRDVLSSNPPPWHLDWSQLVSIAPEAMPLLAGLFESLCAEELGLQFSGAEQLVQALRMLIRSGDRSTSKDWWTLRLNALRVMQLQDEFELAALDFCVTFEVAPPAWEAARCSYASINLPDAAAAGVASHDAVTSPVALPTAPIELDGLPALRLELKGQVVGDATQALAGLEAVGRGGSRVVVSCSGLVRVDFSAAGSILNWVATRQAEGCMVQFRDVHRLVAAFFNVIGINEHARVVPRQI